MEKLSQKEAQLISGGATLHYHWSCGYHGYTSVARDLGSCTAWKQRHNENYHGGASVATMYGCTAGCSPIYSNY